MARASRPRPSAHGSLPGMGIVDRALRPEVLGTLFAVAAAATLPFLLPVFDLLEEMRDSLVSAFGVHVFTLALLTLVVAALAAVRRLTWLGLSTRHVLGGLAMLVFSAGVLGTWGPDVRIGRVHLAVVTAGGDLGDWLFGWPGAIPWLASFLAGFALLWPETAAEVARTAPGAIARGALASVAWFWASLLVPASSALRGAVRREPGYELDEDFLDDDYPEDDDDDEVWGPQALAAPSSAARTVEADAVEPAWPGTAPVRKQPRVALEGPAAVNAIRHSAAGWQLPPLDTLQETKPNKSRQAADTQRRAALIVDTLASFGVDSRVSEINEGPTITQFGVEPGWDIRTRMVQERDTDGTILYDHEGQPRLREVEVSRNRVRVNRITALQNDLALALAAPALRIEAPVPGKPIVGIEVPNASSTVVTMRQLLASPAYRKFAETAALPVALGAGVSGEPVLADLARMPHLLIAGATGAGKSVCLNAIIVNLLMHLSPEELRFVMIDPKRVEMTPYQELPHLAFSNIVVEMDRVVGTLQAVINEMESRYRRFAQAGVRDLKRYNEVAVKTGYSKLPYWVVVVDELADLMLAAPYQVETQIVRLAQLARATGIHLVIATQRPSVDVVTGLIKANFPTRIAFAMSSQVDSRTVLDQGGAEKLLGRGDMLFLATDAQKPKRVQGVYLSDDEIEQVVHFWTAERFQELVPEKLDDLLAEAEREVEQAAIDAEEGDGDPLIEKAVKLALESKTLSASMLQRRLKVGYPRAARIIDELEERGVIGPADGSSSRVVLLTQEPVLASDAMPPAGDEG